MFRSKKDVDRHVKDILIKLRNSEEKTLRCYNIAKLYYQVGDYESVKKYVSSYLGIRNKSAAAHKLLGQALEALGEIENAFIEYKLSLELEPKQDDLVLKVCELLANADVKIDESRIKYWIERADKTFPHHPIVFQLKEKVLTVEKTNGTNEDLEKLITSELSVRQTDVHLHVKLLKHYIGNRRLEDAYNHAAGIEATHSHRNSIVWYQSLSELLIECKESKESDWTFWMFYLSVLERYAALCLKEQGNIMKKSIADTTQAVFNFDQSLNEFKSNNFPNHAAFTENMLLHMWGQLHFHLACLFLRKTKGGEDSWTEAERLCGPLLLTALHVTPIDPTAVWTMHLKDQLKSQVHVWYREGAYRCSQTGHVLQDYGRENPKKLLDKIDKFCTASWRERVYHRIFIGRLYQDGKATSYFANSSLSNPPLRLCSYNELKRFDEISEEVWPDSLHHQIWLGLRNQPRSSQNKDNGPQWNQTSHVFCELQFSVFNLNQAAPDSLSRLDIDAFLNAAIFCAAAAIQEQQLSGFLNPEKLPTLPADLTNTLCTSAQEKWWSSAYKVYSMDKHKTLEDDLGEIRLELQRGLEVVRCIGNHGLHPVLLVHLARIFQYRVEQLKEMNPESPEIADLEARSEMYWSNAIPLLERLQNNQVLRVTNSKFFNYQGKEMNNAELVKALEEGKLRLAQRFVRNKWYEKAIDALQALKCPEASFQQGQMYEMLANEIVSSMPKESLTSEMRSQHIVMLSKARECFYLTLDRLRSPGTNPKHPLNSELFTHIADIENKLKRIDPDLSRGDFNKNECDGLSDESYSSAHSAVDQQVGNAIPTLTGLSASINVLSTPQKNHRTPKQSSTPYRPQHQDLLDVSRNRSEARPSPERLDAQIRSINQMIHAKESMMQAITEQNKTILELNKTLVEKVGELSKEISELRKEIQKQRTEPINVNPNLEEDLCLVNEEDYNELNYNATQSSPAFTMSGYMITPSHRHPYSQSVYPSATAFQGYYAGGMSFSDPNAQAIPSLCPPSVYQMPVLYPNAAGTKMPENLLQQGLFPTRLPDLMPPANQPLQIPLQKVETPKTETIIKDAPVNKVPPVNVVITTSDTLPTTVPVVQPTLSVTIPPHFRQGGTTTLPPTEQSVPHCYQISMPSQATIPTTVNLPPLATTLTTTPANISVSETPKTDAANICPTGSPNGSDHEHDPIPDFVPVIPLPAEVKVTTGEEDEDTLFCARAKLFRFVDNEWKERGIGNVKLLKNSEGKVRLVMRREQVLKVCANHYLTPEMELTAKANNEKAWFWVAHDFADGEFRVEKFCIRFKTVEEGLSFKEHFDKAKAGLTQPSEKGAEISTKVDTTVAIVGSEKAKKEISAEQVTSVPTEPTSEKSKPTATTTVIGGFSFMTTPIIQKVVTTEPSKVTSKPEAVSPFAGFTFNKTVTTADSSVTGTPKTAIAGTTTTQPSTFSFAKTVAPSQVEAPSIPVITESVPPVSIPQSTLRRPHAPPPSANAAATSVGIQSIDAKIENEEVLCEDKISLQYYNNDTKQWENRGIGQIKILWNSQSGKIRLLMTEENTSKVCYNYNLLAKMQFTLKGGSSNNVVNWSIQYGSDKKIGTFAATFKTAPQASKFYSTITNSQQKMVKDCISAENMKKPESTKTQPSLAEMFKPPTGSWECNSCYTRNSASDTNCIACQAPRPSAAPKVSTPPTTTTTTATNQVPLSQLFKPPAGSWKCNTCYIVNTAENNYCVACDTPKDPSMPPKPKTDGFQTGTTFSGTTPTFTFGIPQDMAKKNGSGFTFRLPTSNDTTAESKGVTLTTETDTKADTTKFIFGVQQPPKPTTPPSKESPFTFGSPGKSFGFNFVAKSPAKSPGVGENSEEEVVESDDIQFSPVIPLPDKIEVKTGEEDEEVLYSHRAKLFRYDKTVNEWKERGLGDIKLLRHKETGKLRLIMRREQILKVCLNHFVLPNLELKPKDDKSWIWNAADYSEGEVEHTLFACRFKTADIAKQFKNIIDDAKEGKELPALQKSIEKDADASAKASPTQEIEVLYEMKVTPEEKEAALKLQLPENFYAYKQKPDCPGCIGCREPEIPFSSLNKVESDQKQTTASTIQFSSKSNDTSAMTTVAPAQTPVSSTNMQYAIPNVFNPKLFNVKSAQFTGFSYSTTPSTTSSGSSDVNEKKTTGFSFTIPPSQPSASEAEKSASGKQNILMPETLKICSPSQTQTSTTTSTPFMTPTSTTSTTSIFGAAKTENPFGLGSGKSIFGGNVWKGVSTSSSESIFSGSFNSQPQTTTSTTSIFGTTAPIFGSPALKIESTTSNNSSLFTTNSTTTTFGSTGKTTNSVFDNTTTQFSFNPSLTARTNESPFGISNSTTTNIFETKTATTQENESQKDNGISFLPATDISFSALAAKAPQQAFKTDPNFSFAGAGTAVFGSKSSASTNKSAKETKVTTKGKKDENDEEEGDENENDQEHDPHFEPVVPLPDVIEVRTGEEDEEKVFCERAKLYRYNNATREWKERGVGEMKILHHAGHGTYRLLLRRDQVHKVVCNLLLTPDINFSRLSTSDRAWVWAGMNYAEEQSCVEQLAVKFKNPELAAKFKDTVDKIQQTLSEIREKVTEDNPVVEEPEEDGDGDEEEEEEEEEEDYDDDYEEEDYDDDDDDEEEEHEDEEKLIVFEKRATLFVKKDKEAKWKSVAVGNLSIYYDDIDGAKIAFKAEETDVLLSETIITNSTQLQVNGKECVWTEVNHALRPVAKRTLKVVFSSTRAAQQMYKHFQDGLQHAKFF
ncbi:E3 SUMO-protein ligase RanBP2 [Calliopsis andreniformis]|uniref:E3 SUMO-protein ligase RanBP2 n=1 Tax=Calliopsis andreniformis TaxID=337506 RepID=UPI003FCDE80A